MHVLDWRKSSAFVMFCSVATVMGCNRVERETVDRVTPHDDTVWTSRSDCEARVMSREAGARAPRIGTWNIRYFPDASEGPQSDPDEATDVQWVACAIASLETDILVVQEIKNSEAGLAKQAELIERLNELTGGDWRFELDQCEPVDVQHPGFLFDQRRVTGTEFREIPSLNPDPVCSNSVSPGFAGYFAIEGGPDFHVIAVHSQVGNSQGAFEKRAGIVAALEAATTDAVAINSDTDVIIAGDFNSVGCETCDPVLSNQDEVATLESTIAAFEAPLALLPVSESCTRIADEMPYIDHVLATDSMAEVPADSVAHVAGVCEEISCDRQVNWLEDANDRLSDHCPVLLDLAATDDD
jgi:endonuclease/exonuclease/phosphatase family metal-dependent hydrolase